MRLILKLSFLYCFLPMISFAQLTVDYVSAFRKLELRLQKGDQVALKEVGDFVGDERIYLNNEGQQVTLHDKAVALLNHYSLLNTEEFDLQSHITRQAFLKFYYKKEKQWKFSEFLQVFYLTSIQTLPYQYKLISAPSYNEANKEAIFRHYRREFLHAIELKLYDQVPEILERIGQLKTSLGFGLLRHCLRGKYWKVGAANPFAARLYEAACYALRHYQNLAAAQMILKTIKEEKTYLQGAVEALSYITNIHLQALKVPFDQAGSTYEGLLSQYRTLAALRKQGYRQLFDYEPYHFKNQADYYGKILNTSYQYFWIKYNALQDLRRVHHPKVLWYLAAQAFQQKGAVKYHWQVDTKPLELLSELTGIEVLVLNQEGRWTTQLKDKIARLNFIRYWEDHYQDYSWSTEAGKFINIQEKVQESPYSEQFRRNFRKLHSTDEEVSVRAFRKLANEQPLEALQSLPDKKLVIFPQSYHLPIYPYLSLEVLIRLRTYCEREGLDYMRHLSEIQKQAKHLGKRMTIKQRVTLENKLYESLNLQNVTALEHWAVLSENVSWRLGYSLGRVLQRFYATRRDSLFQQTQHLKLFLNKCGWFAQLRPKGLGVLYPSFLGKLEEEQKQKLDAIWEQLQNEKGEITEHFVDLEQDRQRLKLIIAQIGQRPLFGLHPAFTRFVKEPHAKHWQELNGVKVVHPEDFKVVIKHIRKFRNPEKIQWLLAWLRFQKAQESVPFLMQIIYDQRVIGKHRGYRQYIPLTVSDEVVFILEQIYRHSFIDAKDFHRVKLRNVYRFSKNISPWRQKWIRAKTNYEQWEADFFELKVKSMGHQASLKINTLNNILLSPFFQKDEHRQSVLQALTKVRPQSDLAYLQWRLPITTEDFKYFKNGFESPALVARVVPLIEAKPEVVLAFLENVTDKLSTTKQGELYFELGQTTELWQWLKNANFEQFKQRVIRCLRVFKNTLDSEYTTGEVAAVIFLLAYQDLPIKAKLQLVKKMSSNLLRGEILSQIIFQTRYSAVPALLDNQERLKSLGGNPDVIRTRIRYHILYNLGLPINESFENDAQIRRDLENLSEAAFFGKYISQWYPELEQAVQQADWDYLQHLLKQTIGLPLVGMGREDRRWYALGRFFEINFGSKLGCPPNMYNAQAWDEQISVKAWQQKWHQFVLQKQDKTKKSQEKY